MKIIKKYPNRRLYDTQGSQYITFEDLYQMINRGENFIVEDSKTKEDLTKNILIQIILEQESKGSNILPIEFLKQIISNYEKDSEKLFSNYLKYISENFSQNIESWQNISSQLQEGQFSILKKLMDSNTDIFNQYFNFFKKDESK